MAKDYGFTIVLEPMDEGGFLVLVPALPEVVTHGATETEAIAMAEDAIRLAVTYRLDQGEPIPSEHAPMVRHVKVSMPA